ncbi:MAG: 3-hydroxypropionyl-coenzyme A dehydratase [Candidatus Heimdallarchaeota archaeon AB_125]|nr:MAG: 3-hydroxypropionyl-coenzyme A dehydratase [Candidatus Heimdallarchaeota archaeon AB_125]
MTDDNSILLLDFVGENNNIALITLNRQKALNAFNDKLLDKLSVVLKSLKGNKNLRAVIIFAEGKSWSAGVDLKWTASLGWRVMKAIKKGQKVFSQIENHPLPIIAAINGYALGGGMELALSCDIRIAADTALFGLTETTIGLLPGWGGTYRLPRIVGLSVAKDLILTGRKFSADEALEIGLISEKVTLEELKVKAIEKAETISQNAPIGLREAKKSIKKGMSTSIVGGYRAERKGIWTCFRTKDIREGIKAVFEKRKPEFKGE